MIFQCYNIIVGIQMNQSELVCASCIERKVSEMNKVFETKHHITVFKHCGWLTVMARVDKNGLMQIISGSNSKEELSQIAWFFHEPELQSDEYFKFDLEY